MPQIMKQDPPAREIASARKIITEQDRQIAKSAFALFKQKNYDECLEQLKRLSELRTHDARVIGNKSIVEYYLSNFTKTDEFIKQINGAKKQLEFGMVNTGDELDDIDRSYLLYNQAVISFHLKKFANGINILERLFKIIEPLDDLLAVKVCILLIELYLQTNQYDQAFGMIKYVESALLISKQNGEISKVVASKEMIDFFKPKIHMFKVRFLMRQPYNQCKKELKLAMNSSQNSAEALFLKSNLECLHGNYQKSIKLLNSAPKSSSITEGGHALAVMYYNNMSFVHFCMGKYNLAVLYAMKSLEENIAIMKVLPPMEKFSNYSGRSLQTLSINQRANIMYNMGVSLLFANKPEQAFECLMESQSEYQCNPRYWLRLAEACIGVFLKSTNKDKETIHSKKPDSIREVVGTGTHRKIVICPIRKTSDSCSFRQEGQSAAMPSATLDFGNLCLTNAMLLLPAERTLEEHMIILMNNQKLSEDEGNGSLKKNNPGRLYVECPPGEPVQTKEAYNLRSSILCCHAYIALRLGDYYKSQEYCRLLLKMSHLTAPFKFLAHIYLIESLIKLDKITEALQELSPENLKKLQTFEQDMLSMKTNEIFPKNLMEAQAAMMINVASAYCMRSDYDRCKHILKQVVSMPISRWIMTHAILLSVFCELQMGQVSAALNLLKRNEVFPSSRLVDRVEASRLYANFQNPVIPQINSSELNHRRLHSTGSGLPPGISNNGFTSGFTSGNYNGSVVGGLASTVAFPMSTESSFSSQQRTQAT
ncbi:CCR4-NOT transcription complex subunit 10 isoform X1 [Hydra vulgaris]|nr:CCR4-NOT transcription complex subunit 10 [Hydra vulgaris]